MFHDKKIGQFEFNSRNQLGSGSQGTVYLGIDTKSGEQVAIKCINKGDLNKDSYLRESLKNEISILEKLVSPHIIKYKGWQESQSNFYIIFEHCSGGDLHRFLQQQGFLCQKKAKDILIQLLKGFSELTKHGVMHRDLKPANILIKGDLFKLTDFGYSRQHCDENTMFSSCVGTPLYMSPQILGKKKYTCKSDIWSLGIIYYQCLFGKKPWNGRTKEELLMNITTKRLKFPQFPLVDDNSKSFISRCLELDEENRIGWNDIYKHSLVKSYFCDNFNILDQSQFIITEIKEMIARRNIKMDALFDKISVHKKITQMQFHFFLVQINQMICLEESHNLFRQIDKDQNNFIDKDELYNWCVQNNVKVIFIKKIYQKHAQLEIQTNYRIRPSINDIQNSEKVISQLIALAKSKQIQIQQLICQCDINQDKQIDRQELKYFVLSINPNLSEIDLETILIYFNLQNYNNKIQTNQLEQFFNISDESETDVGMLEEQEISSIQNSLLGPGFKFNQMQIGIQ